jgi:hypothetical protein
MDSESEKKAIKLLSNLHNQFDKSEEDFQTNINNIFDQCEQMHKSLRMYMFRGYVKKDAKESASVESPPAKPAKRGKIRVGRILKSNTNGKKKFPVTNGYKNIIVTSHNKSKLGSALSPYVLKDKKGRIMENIWQFAKIYVQVGPQRQKEWTRDPEVHALGYKKLGRLDLSKITPEYWKWRYEGMHHHKPVRYPNGFQGKDHCICCLWPKDGEYPAVLEEIDNEYVEMEQLGYIEARKRVYAPIYIDLAKQTEDFAELQAMLDRGENIQILDVDGPDETIYGDKSVPTPYNKMKKGVHGVNSEVGSIEVTRSNIKAVLHDESQPFGHGYCLAVALLGQEEWLE